MRPIIKGQVCKSTSPGNNTDPAVMSHSEVFKSINIHELDYQFHVRYNQIVLQINGFQHNGSSWVVDHLQHLELRTRVQQLANVMYVCTLSFIGIRMILDMRTLTHMPIFSLQFFNTSKICLLLIILYCL